MGFSRSERQPATQPTDSTAVLFGLLSQMGTDINYLGKLTEQSPQKDVTDAARKLCLASREVFAELTRLDIERVLLGSTSDDTYLLHLHAVATLEQLPGQDGVVGEFTDLTNQRVEDLLVLRRNNMYRD